MKETIFRIDEIGGIGGLKFKKNNRVNLTLDAKSKQSIAEQISTVKTALSMIHNSNTHIKIINKTNATREDIQNLLFPNRQPIVNMIKSIKQGKLSILDNPDQESKEIKKNSKMKNIRKKIFKNK